MALFERLGKINVNQTGLHFLINLLYLIKI